MAGYQAPIAISLRQWFPEEVYRGDDYAHGLTIGQILRGAVSPSAWGTIVHYWITREPPRPVGHLDILVYFREGYTPGPLVQGPVLGQTG